MAQLPTKSQILTLLRDEPMTGSRLRGALGLPKKLKLSFKQLLAEMVEDGTLNRTCHKEYRLSETEPTTSVVKNKENRRPAARSRRQEVKEEKRNQSMRGILHQIDEDRFVVKDIETGREYPMTHRKTPPGTDGDKISFVLYPHPKLKHSFLAKLDSRAMLSEMSWEEVKKSQLIFC